ncbi:MAG: C40 family peptidase [Lachnospiraceae bacterium]|nr:C40 family peptidase [Lachnospiraceae bacterium]
MRFRPLDNVFMHRIIGGVLVSALTLGNIAAISATTIDKANQKINEASHDLENVNSTITQIEAEQDALQAQINELDGELVGLLLDIDILEDEIVEKQAQIDQATIDLADAQAREEKQYSDMKLRIKYMYEHSQTGTLQYILESESIADLLNRVAYFNDVYDYDREQLVAYQDTVQEVIDIKGELEREKDEMVELDENLSHQSEELETLLAQKRSTMEDFDTQLASAKYLAAQYKETIKKQNAIIAAEEARIAREREAARLAAEAAARREAEEAARRAAAAAALAETGVNTSGSGSDSSSTTTPSTGTGSTTTETTYVDSGKNPAQTTNINGSDVVAYASQFIGNPYVWGGTSLTNGCDCSGFVMKIYEHYGISLPHSSLAMRSCGQEVSYSNAQPGDIICYAGHVALYAGGGTIIGAQSSKTGIAQVTATYKSIITVRRVI